MATRLEKELKRELEVAGDAYILTISPAGLKLARKGRRIGQELLWKDLVNGDAALAVALNATLKQAAPAAPVKKAPRAKPQLVGGRKKR